MSFEKYKRISSEIKGSGLRNFFLLKISEQFYILKFKKLGVVYSSYRGYLPTVNNKSLHKDSRYNDSTAFYIIKKGFEVTGIKYPHIRLLDIGCGYGKILNFGILKNFNQVIGIDLDDDAIKKAIDNCTQLHNKGFKTLFRVHHADACEFMIPARTNVIFLANPFGKKTMEVVLGNIIQYNKSNNIELFIIYAVPVHRDIFAKYEGCKKIYESFNASKINPEFIVFKIFNPDSIKNN